MRGVLKGLFSRIFYPEIAVRFDRLEDTFETIVEDVSLELPENPTDLDVLAEIEKQAGKWDELIVQHPKCGEYVNQVKDIYVAILNLYNSNPESSNRKPDQIDNESLFRPLDIWFNFIQRPASFAMLLYYHQRVKQLNNLLELYQQGADTNMLTSRHLFEKGLSLLRVKEEDYLSIVYDTKEQHNYNTTIQFLTSLKGLLGLHHIEWVKEKNARQELIEKLNQHLKYAALAYRDHTIKDKGAVTDVLDPYEVHFANYGGCDIKGRFHLQGNLNGYVGHREDKTIIVGLSGTEPFSSKNWKTNIRQYFGKFDPVYVQAAGLVHAVWMGKRHKRGFRNSRVVVCGHSLGGGLMQYAVSLCHKDDMEGFGFNSAGLSKANMFQVWNDRPDNIYHLHQRVDIVFTLPFAYQLGKSVNSNKIAYGPLRAHMIGVMRRNAGKYRHDFARLKGERWQFN